MTPWWWTDGLSAGDAGLALDGVPLGAIARAHGTPVYAYGAATARRRIAELKEALATTGRPNGILYALKANRFPGLLEVLRAEGVGADAASPGEARLAVAHAFSEVSVTAGMLSDRDLAAIAALDVHVNLDSRSALRRWAATGGQRAIGLRMDPAVATSWNDQARLAYGNSKFGFRFEDLPTVAAEARALGLEIDTLHVHPGWNLPASAEAALTEVFSRLAEGARSLGTVHTVDVGGGLGWPHRAGDRCLTPSGWARSLQAFRATDLRVVCEPGTYVAATAGALVVEVNTVERRGERTWLGVDAGHNLNVYAAHYGIPHAIVPVADPLAPAAAVYEVAGNINEASDVFARGLALPVVREGDLLAFLPAGAYGSSMASNHCMRGAFAEVMLPPGG